MREDIAEYNIYLYDKIRYLSIESQIKGVVYQTTKISPFEAAKFQSAKFLLKSREFPKIPHYLKIVIAAQALDS